LGSAAIPAGSLPSSPRRTPAAAGTASSLGRYATVTRRRRPRHTHPVPWERATRKGVHEMTAFIPRITIRRAIAGTLVATLAAVPLAVSSTAGAANAVPRCTTRGLEVWLGVRGGGAAAGSTFYPMEFSNLSRHTCQLFGFPGVSAEKGGHQVGRPAGRDNSTPHTVTLHPPGTPTTGFGTSRPGGRRGPRRSRTPRVPRRRRGGCRAPTRAARPRSPRPGPRAGA